MDDDEPFVTAADLAAEQRAKRCAGGRPRSTGKGSRLRKLECDRCGFIARVALGALERCGYPSCGCGERLQLTTFEDRLAAGDPDALELQEREHEAREAARLKRNARGGAADPKRCAAMQCFVFTRGRFCADHEHLDAQGYGS